MNGLGIGTTVGLGTIVALGLVAPGATITAYIMTFLFYGMISGFLFEIYRVALKGWDPPFNNPRA